MELSKKAVPVFILSGGLGTRLSEETAVKPKPMVEIGEIPILIHIMRWYYSFGFDDFVICAGYKSWEIKNYFLTYPYRFENIELDQRKENSSPVRVGMFGVSEKWRVRIIDTGNSTLTGARLARAFDAVAKIQSIDHFAVTYGDGLCNVDLNTELNFHSTHGKVGTVLAVHNKPRFGELQVENDLAISFMEKPLSRHHGVNGGYFFFKCRFREYLSTDNSCTLEKAPLENLARDRELMVFRHDGFWYPIDTLSDKNAVQALWDSGEAPWLRKNHGIQNTVL